MNLSHELMARCVANIRKMLSRRGFLDVDLEQFEHIDENFFAANCVNIPDDFARVQLACGSFGIIFVECYYKEDADRALEFIGKQNLKRVFVIHNQIKYLHQKDGVEPHPFDFFAQDPFEYYLTPRQEIIPKADEEALLKKLMVTKAQLPRMDKDDVIAQWLAAVPGDIIRVFRQSEVTGDYLVHRCVI